MPTPRPFSLSSRPTSTPFENTASYYHALLDVRALIASPASPGETVELFFSLFSKTENRFLTEEFCLALNHNGSPVRDPEQRLGRLRTVFTEMKAEDLAGAVLVCKVVRVGAMKARGEDNGGGSLMSRNGTVRGRKNLETVSEMGTMTGTARSVMSEDSFSVTSGFGDNRTATVDTSWTSSTGDGRPSYRRPFGCAILELPVLSKLSTEAGLEFNMPIYVGREEGRFATLHEDLINRQNREYTTSNR